MPLLQEDSEQQHTCTTACWELGYSRALIGGVLSAGWFPVGYCFLGETLLPSFFLFLLSFFPSVFLSFFHFGRSVFLFAISFIIFFCLCLSFRCLSPSFSSFHSFAFTPLWLSFTIKLLYLFHLFILSPLTLSCCSFHRFYLICISLSLFHLSLHAFMFSFPFFYRFLFSQNLPLCFCISPPHPLSSLFHSPVSPAPAWAFHLILYFSLPLGSHTSLLKSITFPTSALHWHLQFGFHVVKLLSNSIFESISGMLRSPLGGVCVCVHLLSLSCVCVCVCAISTQVHQCLCLVSLPKILFALS